MQRAADFFDALEHEGHIVKETELCLHVVERAGERPFGARAVVADDVNDQGVVAQSHLLDCVDKPADLRVHVLEEAGKHFLHARVEAFLVGGKRIP